MQFSESWLRSYVNPSLSSEELCHALTMAGLEVEESRPVTPPITGVVAARVLATAQHPNADRLKVCQVDAGGATPLNIVCGAPNVVPGMIVPCATVGAVLPAAEEGGEPFKIKLGKLRGVESQGMLCSARELKLSEDHAGLMSLPEGTVIGQDINQVLDLHDHLITIKLTPNKADCLSLIGVAREVQAITGTSYTRAPYTKVAVNDAVQVPVKISAPDLCGRFSGRVVRGLNLAAKTPEWMVNRLARSGQRSISALVDISNYVMLELGRPSHIFDYGKIKGSIDVRWAKDGETLKLLNGNTINLSPRFGVVADEAGPEALAGIMGGDHSAVSDATVSVYIEAAFWWPTAIQGRARALNFSTDAAHRFERGVDFQHTVEDIEYITRLIIDVCGTNDTLVSPITDVVSKLPERKPVSMRVARAQKIIGVDIPPAEMGAIFTRLGLAHTYDTMTQSYVVIPPSYRFDLEIEEDLIEEVARIYGFERIPAKPPVATANFLPSRETWRSNHALRTDLNARGYQEVINFSFVDEAWEQDFTRNKNPIKLLNPMSSNMAVMRSMMIGSLVDKLKHNLAHKIERVRIFELGKSFNRSEHVNDGPMTVAGVEQHLHLGGLAYGSVAPEQWATPSRAVDFFDVKADVDAILHGLTVRYEASDYPAFHPGRCAKIVLGDTPIAYMGELHPKWVQKYDLPQAPVLFEIDVHAINTLTLPKHQDIAKFPAVTRDLALVVNNEISHEQVKSVLKGAASPLTREINLFDVFKGGNISTSQKSLAFRVVMQDFERTLTDADSEQEMNRLLAAAEQTLNAHRR